ncbi:uncharacterized protein BKA55DRAFT_39295 [Fusarium redolens]|uniref:Transmembrane protein n=1 Tax=Fusarium redolens TaxID=48865 RepID=A0A9P9KWW4_FUSRE|nr:uncharacterized protein BKA55DRAFT_39295 [Fusarium redolens]KAH7270270.1 hypothetical protein BKA55DRAFT_39295 [Fusarium redolens]
MYLILLHGSPVRLFFPLERRRQGRLFSLADAPQKKNPSVKFDHTRPLHCAHSDLFAHALCCSSTVGSLFLLLLPLVSSFLPNSSLARSFARFRFASLFCISSSFISFVYPS